MFSLALIVYSLLFPVLFVLYLPFYILRIARRGEWLQGFGERFGLYSRAKLARLRSLHEPIWIHAVSVGETQAAFSFIRAWREREPDRGFILSTTTNTAQQLARDKAPEGVVPVYLSIDWYPCLLLAFCALQPRALLIFEVEIWPALVTALHQRGVPVALLNGRLSDRSAAGFQRHAWFFRPVFRKFRCLCVQSVADAERLQSVLTGGSQNAMTGPPIATCGTMKFDQVPDPRTRDLQPLLDQLFPCPDRLLLCGASTWPGEEALLAEACLRLLPDFPGLRLLLVPRHVERTPELLPDLTQKLRLARLTELRAGQAPPADPQALLVDTTGELMDFMGASDLVFVGKSLCGNDGGHNIIEPALFGKPVLHGPAMSNFREVARLFREGQGAIEIADYAALEPTLRRLLRDADERRTLGERARSVVEQQRGAIARSFAAMREAGVPAPPSGPAVRGEAS